MAEPDLTEEVTIRNPITMEERQVSRGAVPYFPDYVELDKAGHVKRGQSATSATTEKG
jgi:hypothetical protein